MTYPFTAISILLIILLLYCISIEPYSELKAPVRIWDLNANFAGYPRQIYAQQNYIGL